ncbi:MAG: hypothetical protein M1819_002413 [Sarea resinae]|nr:MAG: hypothetical protein M1819_002413 [Sarea resinae]
MSPRTKKPQPPVALESSSSDLSSVPDVSDAAESSENNTTRDANSTAASSGAANGSSQTIKRTRKQPAEEAVEAVIHSERTKRPLRGSRTKTEQVKHETVSADSTVATRTMRQKATTNGVNGHLRRQKDALVTGSSTAKQGRGQGLRKADSKDIKIEHEEADVEVAKVSPRKKRQVKAKVEVDEDEEASEEAPKKKKRKTKEEKEADAMPIASRATGLSVFIGAHVSAAKGVQNAVTNSVHIGANAFALFLKSQRKWENPPLKDEHLDQFKMFCQDHKYDSAKHVVPHGSYLVNLAQSDPTKAKQAYDAFVDDLQRCERLGVGLYNFHPGNTNSLPRAEAIGRIAAQLNRAHAATSSVVTLLETMAGGGNVIGSTFEDLRDIIALVDDKERVGVCLDTCHVFAAGYDLHPPHGLPKTLAHFASTLGLSNLRAIHLNDSKAPLGSHRDLHANIGTGFLGLRTFHAIMNHAAFRGLPMVLETPITVKRDAAAGGSGTGKEEEDKGIWAREIKLLEGLVGMDVESEAFRVVERELWDSGRVERERILGQVERKREKDGEKEEKMKKKQKNRKVAGEGKGKGKRETKGLAKKRKSVKSESESENGSGSEDDA